MQQTVYIYGPLDAQHLKEVQDKVDALEVNDGDTVTIDCTEMSYICSSGMRIFLSMHKDITNRNGRLVIKNVQPLVMKVFEMTGFSNILNFE